MSQKPSVGRIVHYVSRGSADDGRTVGLCAINPSGLFFHPLADGGCPSDPGDVDEEIGYMPGSWHWPERV